MLKRGIEVLVGTALVVVLVAMVPAVAEAQEGAAPAARVVVRAGDTLWSISEERLGSDATQQQIASVVERIYALNRDQIGPDPNVIFAGQELSLPTAGGSSAAEPATKKTAAAAQQSTRPGQETAVQGGRTINREPANQQASLPNLSKVPASAAVPTIGSLATDAPPTTSPIASFQENMRFAVRSAVRSAVEASVGTDAEAQTTADGRRLLGWGIIALTLLVGALMACKLPMRRSVGDPEVWRIPLGNYAYSEALDLRSSSPQPPLLSAWLEPSAKPSVNGSKAEAAATQKSVSRDGLGRIAQRRRQLIRHGSSKRLPRRGRRSAAEAYSAEAQRLLRGIVLRTRAQKPRRSGRIKTARRIPRGGR